MLNEIIKLRIIYYINLYYILNTKLIEYKKPVQLDLFKESWWHYPEKTLFY